MTDDELIERMAEAIRATWADEDEYGDMTEAARAALAVARPAIRNEVLDEAERALAATDPYPGYRLVGIARAEDVVRSLRSDSKGDSDD